MVKEVEPRAEGLRKLSVGSVFIYTWVSFLVIICLFPFLHVFATSFSSNRAIMSNQVSIIPVEFTANSYQVVFGDQSMIRSLFFTMFITVIYTVLAIMMTVFIAYPMTKKDLKGRNFFLALYLFTMYFSGGMIPDYLLIKNLGIMNSMWALIFPAVVSTYNMIIMKSFFQNIPESLLESARLDGCSEIGLLFKIVIPLSKASLATISLFYAVAKWNAFQDALFYITNTNLYPLQLKLYNIVFNNMSVQISADEGMTEMFSNISTESLKAACIMFATIPIIMVYPWLQKYFIHGVMIGAVKE